MQKKLGIIKRFFPEKGFGFMETYNGESYFFHRSAFYGCTPTVYNHYLFIGEFSRKYPSKLECIQVYSISNETEYLAENFLNFSPNERFKIICTNRKPLELISNRYFNRQKEGVTQEALWYVESFKAAEFADNIKVEVNLSETKKPGADDSFTASIRSYYPDFPSYDSYLKELTPPVAIETYYDYGFYSCHSMRKDYAQHQEKADIQRCKEIEVELRKSFASRYSKILHSERFLNDLIRIRIGNLESEVIWNWSKEQAAMMGL